MADTWRLCQVRFVSRLTHLAPDCIQLEPMTRSTKPPPSVRPTAQPPHPSSPFIRSVRKLNERKMPNAFEHAKNAFANADGVLGMATWFRAYGLALLDA